jgi:mono/diheme cytochrome c family protein
MRFLRAAGPPAAFATLAALFVLGLIAAAPTAAPHKADAAAGKKLFVAKGCVACHKADGSGGIKLNGNPTPDWRDVKRMSDPAHDNAYLRDCITNGKMKSGMISWKKTLKPEQIEDLIAYIRTFSKTTDPGKAAATGKTEAGATTAAHDSSSSKQKPGS